jgi:hypothetical protein
MKSFFLIATAMFFGLNLMAQQQDYFVFIQETARQPFYVRMGEISHSSSATGHIILSKMHDSTYSFFIGFAKGKVPEQLFTITINKRDHGFELKNIDGRWQLFDLQSLQLINAAASQQSGGPTVMRSDSYSVLMAGVVDDSAVLYSAVEDTLATDTLKINAEVSAKKDSVANAAQGNDVPVQVNPGRDSARNAKVNSKKTKSKKDQKKEVAVEEMKKDSVIVNNTVEPRVDSVVVKTAAPVDSLSSSVRDKRDIIRLITENVAGGKMMIYVDRTGPVNDTIRIVIPRP